MKIQVENWLKSLLKRFHVVTPGIQMEMIVQNKNQGTDQEKWAQIYAIYGYELCVTFICRKLV